MRTSVIEGNVDTSELQSMLAQARAEEDRLNSQILTLQSRNAELQQPRPDRGAPVGAASGPVQDPGHRGGAGSVRQ